MSRSTHNLIALCASHISSLPRLAHFRQMVESWKEQVQPLPLFVEMSVETPELEEQIRAFVLKINTPLLTITIANDRRSQCGHYQALVDRLKLDYISNVWVLFTDDDDLWHPQRSFVYANGLQQIPQAGLPIISHLYTNLNYSHDTCKMYAHVAKFSEIEHLPVSTYTKKPVGTTCDYVHLCVRFDDLRLFFNVLTPLLRDYQCCDLLIPRFIAHTLSRKSAELLPPGPLYFYRESQQYKHNRPTPKSFTKAIYENGSILLAKAGAKESATVAKVAQFLQHNCFPDRSINKIRTSVQEMWHCPLWFALRNFPRWDEVSGPHQY